MATPNNMELDLVRGRLIDELQGDLNFWRKRLKEDRAEISYYEAEAQSHLKLINETKRRAHEEGIELK